MWRFKPFMAKETTSLEGRTIDVGNVKVHVRNAMAEGGFSCVYLARDVLHASKQYALKQMICNDGESLDLAMKEISVMRLLKGHPNVVSLVDHTILDMGRTKEVLIVMEFCEKSLIAVLDNRGSGYFEEKQVLLIFRDVCNAVFAMHSQSPPIAHRDLKAENVLLGSDGAWKLCDFGSTSTNHKCFDRPEEMGIEEDNIRKYTTPAYRAPEMWDLFRREIISEKVDIWALGCLLYRICYLKSAFDGESKLQILNGNYRIPELPKYSSVITNLIKDMLEASPNARPDITQVWFRVNEQLPVELQTHLPDGSSSTISMHQPNSSMHDEGLPKKTSLMPRRSPPPPPSSREQVQNISLQSEKVSQSRPSQGSSKAVGGPMGSFWSSQHAHDPQVTENKGSLFDKEPIKQRISKNNQNSLEGKTSLPREHVHPGKSVAANPLKKFEEGPIKGFEISFFQEEPQQSSQKTKAGYPETIQTFHNEAFDTFVAEFDTTKLDSRNTAANNNNNSGSGRKELEAEVDRLKGQLKQASLEKVEITSKYEKLSAICRSQRQEIQELKCALAAATPSPQSKDSSRSHVSPGSMQSGTLGKIEGTVWELQQGMLANSSPSPSPEPKPWQAFPDEPKAPSRAAGTTNGHQNLTKQSVAGPSSDLWGFNLESLAAAPFSSQVSRTSAQANTSQRFSSGGTKKVETSQPAGWAGF